MGMAASQARFLGLTARKTNVEYQGQQVNQQRASLANESAGLYNQMVNLKLPLPPSAVNFYSSRYTFENSSLENGGFSIVKFEKDFEHPGEYNIELQYKATERHGFQHSSKGTISSDGSLEFGGATYTGEGAELNNDLKAIIRLMYPNTTDDKIPFDTEAAKFTKFTGKDEDNKNVYYVRNDESNTDKTIYYAKDQTVTKTATLRAALSTDGSTNSTRFTKIDIKNIVPAEAAEAMGIKLKANNSGDVEDGEKTTFDLEVKKSQDDEGYEEATKEYEYQKMLYDRSIQDINAKTESIQQQDKNLELKLRQLDTEQKAIQTEMEAVQKVIQKNVETTFKTFG